MATIKDSIAKDHCCKADFFFLEGVDGRRVSNSNVETRVKNHGQGAYLNKLVVVEREVPARPSTFKIVGRTDYGSDLQAMLSVVYKVSGDIAATLDPDTTYVVTGKLGEDYSAVWIEDTGTGAVVGHKIEVNGSAKLGFWQK